MNLILSQDKNNLSDLCGHIENFLSDTEINDFYSHQTKEFKPAITRYRGLDKSIRDCDKLSGATIPKWLGEKLNQAISMYNDKTYQFDLYPIDSEHHEFNIVRYKKKGQFFTAHRDCRPTLDMIKNRVSMRKISLSIQLSSPLDYGGGNLEVAETYSRPDILSNPKFEGLISDMPQSEFRHKFKTMKDKGSLIIFTSFHLHESTPLEWGKRDVLVGFIRGESQVW